MNYSVPATKLKEEISDVLDAVHFRGSIIVVERYGKPIAKIVPYSQESKTVGDVSATLKKYFGALPNFPDVRKTRTFRKRDIRL